MAHYWSSSSATLPVLAPQPSHPSDSAAGVAVSRDQQNEAFAIENDIPLQLGLGLCNDYWKIEKYLTQCDVSHRQCRLLLPRSDVVKHILPSMQRSDADQCSSIEGLAIKVWDADKSCQFELRLKKWPANKYYVLTGNWIKDFVNRRGLKEGDKVGFTYIGSTLYFKHLN